MAMPADRGEVPQRIAASGCTAQNQNPEWRWLVYHWAQYILYTYISTYPPSISITSSDICPSTIVEAYISILYDIFDMYI